MSSEGIRRRAGLIEPQRLHRTAALLGLMRKRLAPLDALYCHPGILRCLERCLDERLAGDHSVGLITLAEAARLAPGPPGLPPLDEQQALRISEAYLQALRDSLRPQALSRLSERLPSEMRRALSAPPGEPVGYLRRRA